MILLLFPIYSYAQLNWQYRYNDPLNLNDGGYSITTGLNGDVYVAGYQTIGQGKRMVVLSLNAGDTNWVYCDSGCQDGRSVCYGRDNNIYVAGYQGATITSLTTSGAVNWIFPDSLAAGYIYANAVIYADSTVFAAGWYHGWFTVMSFLPSGDTNWVRTPAYGGEGYGIEFGPDSNLYAFGIGNAQAMVVSMTPEGDTNWIGTHPGNYGHFRDIVCDNKGNVYAAGWYLEYYETTNLIVVSFDSLGDTNWVYTYDSNNNIPYDYDEAVSLVMGSDSSLYVAGNTTQPNGSRNLIVISLDREGNERWIMNYPGGMEYWFWPYEGKQTINGPDDHIYIACYSGEGSFQIIKIDTLGTTIWRYRNNGSGSQTDYAFALHFGNDGNLYATGMSHDSITGYDILVVSIGPEGEVQEKKSSPHVPACSAARASPNPFIAYTRIPGNEDNDFMLSDVSGRYVGTYKGQRIGEDLPAGVYFLISRNNSTTPLRIVKVR